MNFFESQDRARRQTSLLVFYYVLAVIMICLSVYACLVAALAMSVSPAYLNARFEQRFLEHLHNPELFFWVVGFTLLTIVLGTVFKIIALSGGGSKVAHSLGGRLVQPNTKDIDERRLLNVVEEMAIASGTSVPPVYLLEHEAGINAFAAGYSPSSAVIGVTKGTIRMLNRAELQGVIAHEFSHIFNGDMRLNIRLIGVLHGILLLAIVGRMMMFSNRRSSYHAGKAGDSRVAWAIGGLALISIGSLGVLFGKLIKSAVSRQREYLADASAVQFTRDPAGLADALKRIGGYMQGSRIQNVHAEEASHMFFANGISATWSNLMATHPPIENRISRLDPSFSGELPHFAVRGQREAIHQEQAAEATISGIVGAPHLPESFPIEANDVIEKIGDPSQAHISYAHQLLRSIPAEIIERAHDKFGARAVIYSLLIDPRHDVQVEQVKVLANHDDENVLRDVIKLHKGIQALGDHYRLPLVDLCIPALQMQSKKSYLAFRENIERLTKADNHYSLFEYTLQKILVRHLDPVFINTKPPEVRYREIGSIAREISLLISVLAYAGHDNVDEVLSSFRQARDAVDPRAEWGIRPRDACTLNNLDKAVDKLAKASGDVKKHVLSGCIACIANDGMITVHEAELVRAIADMMDCPIPPFLPNG